MTGMPPVVEISEEDFKTLHKTLFPYDNKPIYTAIYLYKTNYGTPAHDDGEYINKIDGHEEIAVVLIKIDKLQGRIRALVNDLKHEGKDEASIRTALFSVAEGLDP